MGGRLGQGREAEGMLAVVVIDDEGMSTVADEGREEDSEVQVELNSDGEEMTDPELRPLGWQPEPGVGRVRSTRRHIGCRGMMRRGKQQLRGGAGTVGRGERWGP